MFRGQAGGVYKLETALAAPYSCPGRAPLLCFLEALGQKYLEWQAMWSCPSRIARAVEETVDGNVLTHAGLSSNPLMEKHLTKKSGRRRQLYEDYKKALTSELAAKRMKTGNQFARIDGADTKRLRDTLSKEMWAYQCAGFRTFHDLRGVFSCTEDGTRMEEPAKENIADFATRWYEYCNDDADPALWKSKRRVQTLSPEMVSFTYDSLFWNFQK